MIPVELDANGGEAPDAAGAPVAEGGPRGQDAGLACADARAVLDSIPQLVWRARARGDWTWGSRQWAAYTGQGDPSWRGDGWLDAVHPDDRGRTMAAWQAAWDACQDTRRDPPREARGRPAPGPAGEAAGDRADLWVEHRLRRASDGAYRWFQTRAVPCRGADGAAEWVGTSTDVHELRSLREREKVLACALRERVRASLAAIRALVRDAGYGEPGPDVLPKLGGRLDALARVQAMLIRDPFRGPDLGELLLDELRVAGIDVGGRVRVEGPEAPLPPRAAEAVALAVHELVTNAAAHGALGARPGRVSVTWGPDPSGAHADGAAPGLRLTWRETFRRTGAPGVEGFGLGYLRRTLPRKLGARVDLAFAPDGLTCEVSIPGECLDG